MPRKDKCERLKITESCLDREDDGIDLAIGSGREDFVAVNVKLFLGERDGSTIHTSPGFRHEQRTTVVIEAQPVRWMWCCRAQRWKLRRRPGGMDGW
jgi:hypothetical protein